MADLVPGIVRIPTTKRDNAFLVDGHTLVDVGWGSAPDKIERYLGSLNGIERVIITHAHPDHVKGLAELKQRTGVEVLIHAADAPWLRAGRVPPEGRSGVPGRIIDKLLHWTPVTADVLLEDGDEIGNLQVIHTPGHTPGHVALLHRPTNALLVGDLIFNRGKVSLGPAALAADPNQRPESLRKLPQDVSIVGLAHGEPLSARAYAAVVS